MNRRPLFFLILSSSAFFSFSHPLSRLPRLHLSHTLSHSSSTSTLLGLPVLHQAHPRPVRLCYTVKPPHPRRRPEVESTTAALFLELSTQSDPISSHKSFSVEEKRGIAKKLFNIGFKRKLAVVEGSWFGARGLETMFWDTIAFNIKRKLSFQVNLYFQLPRRRGSQADSGLKLEELQRDIKGANILVDPNGEIKLADFGMAKHITNCASMLSFKGSPYWMAPEVVMNINGYSLAVDIWSLGCTILEMATSKPPWSQYEGVAAIFKIGNSKDMPDIPEYLSPDAKSFVRLCLQRNPSERPTASQLLDHPFIREQMTTRSSNIKPTKDAFPYAFDGSRTPPILELHSNRTSITLCDTDHTIKPTVTTSRAMRSPRENARMITSLPVSPCSSPLRQYGPAHQSCFLSPPHPSYGMMGQSNYNMNEYSSYARPNTSYPLEPWREAPLLRSQTPPGGSPRTRPI